MRRPGATRAFSAPDGMADRTCCSEEPSSQFGMATSQARAPFTSCRTAGLSARTSETSSSRACSSTGFGADCLGSSSSSVSIGWCSRFGLAREPLVSFVGCSKLLQADGVCELETSGSTYIEPIKEAGHEFACVSAGIKTIRGVQCLTIRSARKPLASQCVLSRTGRRRRACPRRPRSLPATCRRFKRSRWMVYSQPVFSAQAYPCKGAASRAALLRNAKS